MSVPCASHQLVLLAAGFRLLLGQFSHLLLRVSDLPLQTFVLLLLAVLAAAALVAFLGQLLDVLLQTGHQALTANRREGKRLHSHLQARASVPEAVLGPGSRRLV